MAQKAGLRWCNTLSNLFYIIDPKLLGSLFCLPHVILEELTMMAVMEEEKREHMKYFHNVLRNGVVIAIGLS